MRPRPLIGFVVALCAGAVVAAACGSTPIDVSVPDIAGPTPEAAETDQTGPTATPAPSPTPTPEPVGRADIPDDTEFELGPRLAVQTVEGQLVTMLGDGTNAIPLTNPDEGRFNHSPRWSDDGNRLAWVAAERSGDAVSVRTSRFDGSAWGDIALRDEPFHLEWDVSGSQVATLSRVPAGVFELGVVDVDGELGYRAIDQGAPYWFAWNTDADGFLVNATGLRLDLVPIDGPSQVLEQNPGRFQAPTWLDDPTQLIYADRRDGEEFLVVAGAEGGGRRALITYDGYLQFSASAESGLIALHVIDPSLAPVPDVITASFQRDEIVDDIDPIPRNQLTIMALFGGDPFVLYPPPGDFQSPFPVRAFWWSGDGQLAWILELDPGDGNCASETAQWQVQFWTGTDFAQGPVFIPTPTLACEYVPGFDQLDQSVSFWSPDGALFTYAGTDPFTGERGIWNHQVGTFLEPTLVAEGEIAVWSPQNAGSAAQSAL
ncbi:MAG: hypothetical protein AAF480_05500 [Actinomycetota bacterium]